MNNKQLSQATYEAAMIQSQAFRALSSFMNKQLSEFRLTLSEWKVLGHLNEINVMTPSEISKLLNVKSPISSRLLKSLGSKGLLTRRKDKTDNRIFHITITSEGRGVVARVEKRLRESMKEFLADVDRSDLENYLKVLNLIARKIDA